MEHHISIIMEKHDLFEYELKKDDEPISDIKQRMDLMYDIFKTIDSFKTYKKKRKPRQHSIKNTSIKVEKEEEHKH
jgi:hypothetical protein